MEEEAVRLRDELQRKIRGEVLFDDMSRMLFSTDASLYQIKPMGVVLPRTRRDLVQAVRTAAKHHVPILPRGGGTSLAGQTVSHGLVIDCSKYLTNVLEVNPEERWVRVEPGVVLDNLNDLLSAYGLFFAPDVATSSRATIGGMIGNNSAGVRSVRYGKTVDHVLALTVLLSTGEELTFEPLDQQQLEAKCVQDDREGSIYRRIRAVVDDNREEILKRFPKVMRRVGGYNLDEFLQHETFNLAKLIVGSEGTLATVVEAKLALEPIPAARSVCVLHFDELIKAIDAVRAILTHRPTAVEILDQKGLELAAENPTVAMLCRTFIQEQPKAILMVEFSGERRSDLEAAVLALKRDDRVRSSTYSIYEGWEPAQQATVWAVRKNALGVLLSLRGDAKPLPFIEDACIPIKHLSNYIQQVIDITKQHGRDIAMYAHASVGVIHVRPILNLKQQEDVEILRSISEKSFQLVREYGGAWSGEHGDGLVRSYKNPEFFGPGITEAFRKVKAILDPPGLMNPGKIVEQPDIAEDLRIHPGYRTASPKTHFRYDLEQGFDRAIEMCTGVGQCRKTLGGSMCPSYMATRDEEHSTRGRANALRSAIAGHLGPEGLAHPRLYEVLDLCLECKACKAECPSSVDMAKLKSEFLANYDRQKGLPLAKKVFGRMRKSAEFSARVPRMANALQRNFAYRWLLEKGVGIDRRRGLPDYAVQSFPVLFRNSYTPPPTAERRVALFADTFVSFFEPRIGASTLELLKALNVSVELVAGACCGRPLISCGLLAEAKIQGHHLLNKLLPFVESGTPILALEPSCLAALRDDYQDLMEDRELARRVAAGVVSLEEFLSQDGMASQLAGLMHSGPQKILYHGHCQQKALWGTGAAVSTLKALPGIQIQDLDSGCCGMAGSFGYEKKHYEISRKVGDRVLLPAVRSADRDTVVVAPGFSCRLQIRHFSDHQAVHPAEVLAASILARQLLP